MKTKTAVSPQAAAQKKLAQAERRVTATKEKIKRLVAALARWDRRVLYYQRLAAISDEARAANKAAAAVRRAARPRRRGIDLTAGVGGG